MKSIMAISQELLFRHYNPFKYILTYKFSQDHIELLFNKIRRRCGWNNNPNVLQFKYTLRSILLRNSIEPSRTGNCTHFDDALCESNGLLNIVSKCNQHIAPVEVFEDDSDTFSCEEMLIQLDQESPNELLDNVLYYIAGYVVRAVMKKLKCTECKSALLLAANNPHALDRESYPLQAKFTCYKQNGGLLFPSQAVLKIVKVAEVIFKKRVLWLDRGVTPEKNLDLKIQYAVFKQLGPSVFTDSLSHYFDHILGAECDHLSSLLKLVTQKYLTLRLKTYGKRFTEMIAHKNDPSIRHHLTKTILFRNQ